MNPITKRYLISTATTFGTAFILTIAVATQLPTFTFSKATIASIILSALYSGVRAVGKFLIEAFSGGSGDQITASTSTTTPQ